MANTYIDTNALPRVPEPGAGEVTDVLNEVLCGAKNVLGRLRWLGPGDRLALEADDRTHHLVYVMEGEGTISLDGKSQDVGKGAGIYLGPTERADIGHRGSGPLKLFHLAVPRIH